MKNLNDVGFLKHQGHIMRILPLLILPLLTACDNSASRHDAPAPEKVARFIAFGDAGRANDNQYAVANAMAELCQAKGCDFTVELGDNIYNNGVTSVDDEQFQTKFEQPYALPGLDIPFYVVLGNHDNGPLGLGGDNKRGEYQVEYTSSPKSSGKWQMPSRYYAFTVPLDLAPGETPLAEFFALDSSPLAATLSNPFDTKYNYTTYGAAQLQWFQTALRDTKARWTLTLSHHPYLSNGSHNNAGQADGFDGRFIPGTASARPWKELLDASACNTEFNGGVDMMLYGHDHDLQWLQPTTACNAKTEFILSGGGSDTREFGDAKRNPVFWQKDMTPGFFWFEIREKSLLGEAYTLNADMTLPLDDKGKPKPAFTRVIEKP